jgi:sulfur carrier protein
MPIPGNRAHPDAKSSETKEILIVINGDATRVPAGLNVEGLLRHLQIDVDRVAVELNREIVRKPEWPASAIEDGAQLEIVWFVGGGRL